MFKLHQWQAVRNCYAVNLLKRCTESRMQARGHCNTWLHGFTSKCYVQSSIERIPPGIPHCSMGCKLSLPPVLQFSPSNAQKCYIGCGEHVAARFFLWSPTLMLQSTNQPQTQGPIQGKHQEPAKKYQRLQSIMIRRLACWLCWKTSLGFLFWLLWFAGWVFCCCTAIP